MRDFEVHPPKPRKRRGIQIVEIVEPHSERKTGPKVLVQRITQKEVSEYEAEILCRHGWERVDKEDGVTLESESVPVGS